VDQFPSGELDHFPSGATSCSCRPQVDATSPASLSPAVKYHGLGRLHRQRRALLMRPQLNSGTLGRLGRETRRMRINVGPQATDSPLFGLIARLSTSIAAWEDYEVVRNDVSSFSSARRYLGSRCVDQYLSSSVAYLKWERCQTVELPELNEVCSGTSASRNTRTEADVVVLASIIRPSLEMFVDLIVLQEHAEPAALLEHLCQVLIWKGFHSDMQQKLASCRDTYDCEPSYFKRAAAGYGVQIDTIRSKLNSKQIDVLAKPARKYLAAWRASTDAERMALGPDSFFAFAGLAYKLHFLPQQNLTHDAAQRDFLRSWCALLLVLLGNRLAGFLGASGAPTAEISKLLKLKPTSAIKSSCPKVEDIVLFDWGVGRVRSVEHRESGNEVLSVAYEILFTPGIDSPDRVPRRFMKCQLHHDHYEAVRSEQQISGAFVCDAARALPLYQALYDCRLDAIG
jgi:hypothetical protein